MKALGALSHETKSGNLLVRGNEGSNDIPSMYSRAGTKRIKVGKINDVIGPKSRPYVVVKPDKRLSKKELSSLKGETFYEYSRRTHAKKRSNSARQKGRVH